MAKKKQDDTTNRVTPRHVEPDSATGGGSAPSGGPQRHDRALRDSDNTVEADGGDQAGVSGGAIDGKVSGRGGDRR